MKKAFTIIILALFCLSFGIKRVNALNIAEVSNYMSTLELDCDIFGEEKPGAEKSKFKEWLGGIYSFIKFLAPTLAVIMSVVEFFKAIVSDKKEALQTAAKRTGIRIALVLVIFFIPFIINFVFGTLLHMCGTAGIE